MLRTIAVACSMILSACASMPDKPIVETGQLDIHAGHVLTGLSDGSDPIYPVPLDDYDKAQCFKPKAWEDIKVYIHLLERFASQCQKVAEVGK
jgi:hypothetical protein